MILVRLLRWFVLGISAVLLMVLGFALLWLSCGGLLENEWGLAAFIAVLLQVLVLLCVTILAVCRSPRGWGLFLSAEVLATVLAVAFGADWNAPGLELLMAVMPLLCAAALAGLNALLCRAEKVKENA